MNSKITLLCTLITFSLFGMEAVNPNEELIKLLQDAPASNEDTAATIKMVQTLLEQNASINYVTNDGNTPFIAALLSYSTDKTLIEYLLSADANPNLGHYDKMDGITVATEMQYDQDLLNRIYEQAARLKPSTDSK